MTMGTDIAGTFDYCDVCGWSDDDVQAADPDFPGGANKMSLNQARANFKKYGAKSLEALNRVRKPLPEEMPSASVEQSQKPDR